jgi:hypothetical protein
MVSLAAVEVSYPAADMMGQKVGWFGAIIPINEWQTQSEKWPWVRSPL